MFMQTGLNLKDDFSKRLNVFMSSNGFSNPNQLGHHLGYKNSEKISRLFRSVSHKPSYDILRDLCIKFPNLSISWLLTGRGNMLKNEEIHSKKKQEKVAAIPLYEQFILPSKKTDFKQKESVLSADFLDAFTNIFGIKNVDVATYVYGNSMSPHYLPGDVILLKRLASYDLIHYGHLYLVATAGYQVLRYVTQGRTSHLLRLYSCNEHYADLEISRENLLELYKVQGFFRRLDA